MPTDWLRVFQHELSRRRALKEKNPKLYSQIWMSNPKRIDLLEGKCDFHIWVPATHLMIHDSVAKTNLHGIKTRGFSEAAAWTEDDFLIVPQICWKCDASREFEIRLLSAKERLEEFTTSRPKKERKRRYTIESTFEELFAD